MNYKSLDIFIKLAKKKGQRRIVVAAAEDEPVLQAIKSAFDEKLIEPILIGNKIEIEKIIKEIEFDLSQSDIINIADKSDAAKASVQMIRDKKADIIMKGHLSTAEYLKAILDKENGLRKGALLSHIGIFESQHYHKLIGLTDAAQNIAPTLEDKIAILNNSIEFFERIGIVNPKVAALAAVEVVNTKMQATTDAAMLTQMNRRNQIKGCIIDGPLAFDNAISKDAAEHKGIVSEVAGDADLLLAPDIESGNILYKALTYMGGATVAAIILGASAPIVLTSRSDTDRSKLMSIALAAAISE